MALIKNIELDTTGVNISYWNINSYEISYLKNEGISGAVIVNGYLDKAARNSNKNPIEIKSYELDKYLVSKDDKILKILYEFLKTVVDFSKAQDDL